MRRIHLSVGLLLLLPAILSAGDPLPPGAVARLGTTRFRHQGATSALAFSPDGKTLAVRDYTVLYLFEAATGREITRIGDGMPRLWGSAVAYSPDGKILAYEGERPTVVLWDTAARQPLRTLQRTGGWQQEGALSFSPDGKTLAVVDGGTNVSLFETATGKLLRTLDGQRVAVTSPLAFSPDGKTLAVGHWRGPNLWDVAAGRLILAIELPDANRRAIETYSLAFSPDGKTLASGGKDCIRLLDPTTGRETCRCEAPGASYIRDLTFTPDGKTLLSIDQTGALRVWDLAARKERFTLDNRTGFGNCLALAPDGKTVAAGTGESIVRLWDIAAGKELSPVTEGHNNRITAAAFLPDGRTLISGSKGRILLWDTTTWRQTAHLRGDAAVLSVNPDGKRLAALDSSGKSLRVWDLADRREIQALKIPRPGDVLTKAAFTAGGTVLAILDLANSRTGGVGTARLTVWDGKSGRRLRELPVRSPYLSSLAISPGGRTVVTGDHEAIYRYDLRTGDELYPLPGSKTHAPALVFEADGRMLFAGDQDGKVRLWEVASGQLVHSLETYQSHPPAGCLLALSPDGRLLASAPQVHRLDDSRRIRIWDVISGKPVATFEGHTHDVTLLTFSPDSTHLVSGFVDGTLLVWDMVPARRSLGAAAPPLSGTELRGLWEDLAGADARAAYRAVWALAQHPGQAVPFLGERLRPAAVDAGRLEHLIEALGSDDFAEREKALKELESLGDVAAARLRAMLDKKPPPEVRRRCEALLEKARGPLPPGEVLRGVRGVQALERIGNAEAVALLRRLAAGAAGARLTEEAKESLERLAR